MTYIFFINPRQINCLKDARELTNYSRLLIRDRTVNGNRAFIRAFRSFPLCIFTRFVNGMVYYGISLASDDLGGNMYRDFVLTSLVEIPGNILVIVLSNR